MKQCDELNIDSEKFALDIYVDGLLRNKSLEHLLQYGNVTVAEIKSLDSDMQMLVYENYNKFISATDTVKRMKNRVESVESQMMWLEDSLRTVTKASDGVHLSISTRRRQLERLSGAQKHVAKLQFLLNLPASLQRYVRDDQLDAAVQDYRRARRILSAMAQVDSLQGIHDEATLIMRGLSQSLGMKLEQTLSSKALVSTTRLLLQLDGDEASLLREFLARRCRALHEALASFSPPWAGVTVVVQTAATANASQGATLDDHHGSDRQVDVSSEVAQAGNTFVQHVIELCSDWHQLSLSDEPARGSACLNQHAKETVLFAALHELTASFIEACARQLKADSVRPDQLLSGLCSLVGSVGELDQLVPRARIAPRAVRVAEQLAKRAIFRQLQSLQVQLTELSDGLPESNSAGLPCSLQHLLCTAEAAAVMHVQDTLDAAAPLLLPLCELLGIRAEGMARYLVTRLHVAVQSMAHIRIKAASDATGMLARAGLFLKLVYRGVPQVSPLLAAKLLPRSVVSAAVVFDEVPMIREMQLRADVLMQRFVEVRAQLLTLDVIRRMQTTYSSRCSAPREVSQLVQAILVELNAMHTLTVQVISVEPRHTRLPQGAFPATSSHVQFTSERGQIRRSSTAIEKDVQRIFTRKVLFQTGIDGNQAFAKLTAHVAKLTVQCLVEEVRLATFTRSGFQQLQLDFLMLRWVLPPIAGCENSLVPLIDESLTSCQERCLECAIMEHATLQSLCEVKRKELTLRLVN